MEVTRPHKAETAELDKLTFPAIGFPKVDGVRGIQILPSFTSRELKPFLNWTVTTKLSHPLLRGMDGEMALGDIRNPEGDLCRKTDSFVRTYYTGDLPPDFTWNVFDYVTEETAYLPYATRFKLLKAVVEEVKTKANGRLDFLRTMPDYKVVRSLEEFLEYHTENKAKGYEGTIYRKPDAPHKNGRSTVNQSFFMRLKDFADAEGIITGVTEAMANLNEATVNPLGYTERSSAKAGLVGKGMIGAVDITMSDGEVVRCGPGCLTHDERIYYFHNQKEFLGQYGKFTFMPYGQFKKRRFPQFAGLRAVEDIEL